MNAGKKFKTLLLFSLLLFTPTLWGKQITIIGCGYVGLCLAGVLANNGHSITCIDIDKDRIASLNAHTMPLYEPQLQELLFTTNNNLLFSHDLKDTSDIYYICVQTPNDAQENCNLSFLWSAFSNLLHQLTTPEPKIVCIKSTVPPGTMRALQNLLVQEHKEHIQLVYNPEFMREGSAIHDIYTNNPVVLCGESDEALQAIGNIYANFLGTNCTVIKTSFETGEIIKYAWNSFSALRITFVNELAYLCRICNADIKSVIQGIALSEKLLPTASVIPGPGYGGSCLPKDTNTLANIMGEKGFSYSLINQTIQSNKEHKKRIVSDIFSLLGRSHTSCTVTLLGLSFKEHTNDSTNAPSRDIIQALLDNNVTINAYDPKASDSLKECFPQVNYFNSPYDAVKNSDCIVVLNAWDEIKNIDLARVALLCRKKRIFDTKNIWSPEHLHNHGFAYLNMGLMVKEF